MLFDIIMSIMKYNKLVRDKIPEIIKKKGGIPVVHIADNSEYWGRLKEKLREEVKEFEEAESIEEIADILEVIDAIIYFKKFNKRKLESVKVQKRIKRGGFRKKIILKKD